MQLFPWVRRRAPDGIGPSDAHALVQLGDATLLDVREPDEWAAAQVPGSLHIPLRELRDRIGELPCETRIVVVCRSGRRSGLATKTLRRQGLAADNLLGGLRAWSADDLPLEPSPERAD